MRRLLLWGALLACAGAMVIATPAQGSRDQASSSPLAACFGHNGTELLNHIAYECIAQPSGLGGALYWSVNESSFNWDKHPGSGLDWVEASTLHPAPDANPPTYKQSFWVGIGRNHIFCTVIGPGYGQHPTQCEENGMTHVMTAKQQASYDQFAAAMVAANLPDCAWSMTISSDQCDID